MGNKPVEDAWLVSRRLEPEGRGQDRAGQGRAGQDRTGQDRTGQDRGQGVTATLASTRVLTCMDAGVAGLLVIPCTGTRKGT
ncbi:MAG: hypothetical protein ACYDGY_09070 [Acidimicrobiales bacterium]